ncbi:hypothetical protein ACOME3_001440 [Neoechinorhynchus agilis]
MSIEKGNRKFDQTAIKTFIVNFVRFILFNVSRYECGFMFQHQIANETQVKCTTMLPFSNNYGVKWLLNSEIVGNGTKALKVNSSSTAQCVLLCPSAGKRWHWVFGEDRIVVASWDYENQTEMILNDEHFEIDHRTLIVRPVKKYEGTFRFIAQVHPSRGLMKQSALDKRTEIECTQVLTSVYIVNVKAMNFELNVTVVLIITFVTITLIWLASNLFEHFFANYDFEDDLSESSLTEATEFSANNQ